MDKKRPPTCKWCGTPFPKSSKPGQPRKFCSPSCKQRAYEQKKTLAGTGIPADAIILRPEDVSTLRDNLYTLLCLAQDISSFVKEGGDDLELIEPTCAELVELAGEIDKIRFPH